MSYKKAVKSYQNNHDVKKYGNLVETSVKDFKKRQRVFKDTTITAMGRKDKLGR